MHIATVYHDAADYAAAAAASAAASGRYKDPQQHQQRLVDMQARCAALFNGTMTQHW